MGEQVRGTGGGTGEGDRWGGQVMGTGGGGTGMHTHLINLLFNLPNQRSFCHNSCANVLRGGKC